jgi:toxin ParE1/3/4
VLREAARRDIDEAVAYYVSQHAAVSALELLGRLEGALGFIARHPHAGSPRYAHILGLEDLRSWLLDVYPYLIFYVPRQDHIDVWRVLHGERDLPAWMRAEE